MPSGIFGATITTLTNGTTANASDVMASLNSLKSNGLNNDSAQIQTDGSGNIITPKGQLRNVTFITPYHLTTNPTVNSGTTTTLTCTGGSTGVPTGAIAVIIGGGISSGTVGAYVTIAPHGATIGQYGGFTATLGGTSLAEFMPATIPLSGGQIDVHANSGNVVLQDWYIIGYFI